MLLSTLRTLLVGLAVLCATLAPSNAAAMVACDEGAAAAAQDAPDYPHAASHFDALHGDAVADGHGTAGDTLSGHGQSDDHCSLHACVFGAIADGADGAVWPIGGMPTERVAASVVKTTLDGPRRPPRI